MRVSHAIPMFAAAFLLGANLVGTVNTVRMRVADAISTTTTYSAPLESPSASATTTSPAGKSLR